jgi:crotonobetainyl-CoA:carnitine CoA-transferase CaiB-like acyl-CoA transferase
MPTNGGSGPLAGIRVIDLSNMISGPLATMILGDQGADVIKVEAPGMGDPMRMFGAMRRGMASTFVNLNRSKRSIVIDLRGETGKEILRRLIREADVFVQNFRPGVVERLGFGHDAVRALAADIVYASISGFGDTGPFSNRPVYDNVVQALSGVAAVQADPDTGKPELVRNLTLDKATAYTVAQAVTAALLARARGRGGQHVRIAMLDAAIAFLWPDGMMNHTFLGDDVFRVPPIATIYRIFPTADGSITVVALTDDQWARTCRATDREDLIEDPRFRSMFDRMTHMQELREIVTDIIATRTTAEWCALYEKHDVPHAPVLSLDEVPEHPQVRANGVLVETEHPTAGRMRQALPAARFDATPTQPDRPAPTNGEHTDQVLGELGYSREEIAALRESGTVA